MSNAQRLIFRSTGAPVDCLEVESFAPAPPKDGEVRVRLTAAPINPADLNTIEGTYGVKLELPAVPGIEGCGVVEESQADGYFPGDLVMFIERAGTWATHATVPASILFKLPADIDPLQAAMLKVNPATAWRLLNGFARLETGEWIVQNLGNSAVARCVIQLARDFGIKTISFVRRKDVIEELTELGGDAVLLDDDEGQATAREIMGGSKARLAFNAVGGESAMRVMKLLDDDGIHITYGAMGRKPVTIGNGQLIFKGITVTGLWVTRWLERAEDEQVREVYGQLAERVAARRLVQPIDSTYALADFKQALERLDAKDRDGKVLFADRW
ncbi:MAG: 2-enoyl thioester reductase domain-containing protein [Akkermansiaceae bacterium]|nr:2-enoyl thioester reductase domain-containing protein [Akkermansiaceae bacterium]